MARRKTPQYYYNQQKQNAKRRGIAWEFDFEDWWKIWRDSGKWGERGCNRGQFVMARNGDSGSYRVGNVSIVEAGFNGSEALKGWGEKKRKRELPQINNNVTIQQYNKPKVEVPLEKFIEAKPKVEEIFLERAAHLVRAVKVLNKAADTED
jgi:hypothetical protein